MKRNLVIKGKKGQQLNQREFKLIYSGAVEGVLLLDIECKKNYVNLKYNTNGLIRMKDFLRMNEITKRLFVVMLRNIVVGLKSMENNRLSRDLISWNIGTTYVNPSSWHVYLMYIPLQPYEITGNLKNFLQEFISTCNFSGYETVEYVQELVNELNAEVTYTISKLEQYCDRVSEKILLGSAKQMDKFFCPACLGKLMSDENVCPFCGTKITKQLSGNEIPGNKKTHCTENDVEQGTIVVNEDANGLLTVFKGTSKAAQTMWLEDRERTGKIIPSKFPFRLGKMDGVTDYRIYNSSVSRKHADIIKERGTYYVVDLGSTNGTYLSGIRLQPGVKEALTDGSILRFADAEFKVHID